MCDETFALLQFFQENEKSCRYHQKLKRNYSAVETRRRECYKTENNEFVWCATFCGKQIQKGCCQIWVEVGTTGRQGGKWDTDLPHLSGDRIKVNTHTVCISHTHMYVYV